MRGAASNPDITIVGYRAMPVASRFRNSEKFSSVRLRSENKRNIWYIMVRTYQCTHEHISERRKCPALNRLNLSVQLHVSHNWEDFSQTGFWPCDIHTLFLSSMTHICRGAGRRHAGALCSTTWPLALSWRGESLGIPGSRSYTRVAGSNVTVHRRD